MKKRLLATAAAALMGSAQQKPPSVVSTANAEHYVWGNCCDGWYLVKTAAINIIQERMPANTSETLHRHEKARQFFYVLSGVASIEREGAVSTVNAGEGLEVPPGMAHKVANRGAATLELMVTSQPPSHDDRIEIQQ